MLNEITNATSFSTCIVAMVYMIIHLQHYRVIIVIPTMFAIAGAFFNEFPDNYIVDILYDMAIVVTMVMLVWKSTVSRKSCKACKL